MLNREDRKCDNLLHAADIVIVYIAQVIGLPAMGTLEYRVLAKLHAISWELAVWENRELSARELAVFLACYLEGCPDSVCELEARLGLLGPSTSQTLDRLERLDLVRRREKLDARQTVTVVQTDVGRAFLRDLAAIGKLAWPD